MTKEPKYCARLKKLREDRGLTQREVARVLGVERKTYQVLESGRYIGGYMYQYMDMKASYAVKLARFYGVSVDYILGGKK